MDMMQYRNNSILQEMHITQQPSNAGLLCRTHHAVKHVQLLGNGKLRAPANLGFGTKADTVAGYCKNISVIKGVLMDWLKTPLRLTCTPSV